METFEFFPNFLPSFKNKIIVALDIIAKSINRNFFVLPAFLDLALRPSARHRTKIRMAVCALNQRQESPSVRFVIKTLDLEKYLQDRLSADVTQPDFSGKRVLVAEDMSINREIAAEILKQTGAETEFAEDGDICLQMIEEAPAGFYDLILMDIMMPNMDGIETTKRIRPLSDPEKAKIPVIAMTSNVSERDREAALAAGMDAFEEKPIFIDKLFETMRQFLYK